MIDPRRRGGEGGTHIFEDGRELLHEWPPFLTFCHPIGTLFYAQLSDPPFILQKKDRFVSITFHLT